MPSTLEHYIPQSVPLRRSQLLMWVGAAVGVLLWMGLIVGAPLARAGGYSGLALIIYKAFSPLCHQIADRSLHIHGHALAVCSRCTGVYMGFAAGVLFYPLVRSLRRTDTPARAWLIAACVPMLIDWSLGFFDIWANTHVSRLLTGGILGVVASLYVVPGLMDVLQTDWRRFFGMAAKDLPIERTTTSSLPPDRAAPSDYSSPSSRI